MKITIPRSTLMQMWHNGDISTFQGVHGTSYGLEYKIHPSITPSILKLLNIET